MPTITSPLVETITVVTGTMYQISIAEGAGGTGITRLEIGPYYFPGVTGHVKYPEAPTSELTPPDFQPLRWVTKENGASYMRFEGGRIRPEDGEQVFQLTSNFPPASDADAVLTVWRGTRTEDFKVPCPDYTQKPPRRNARRDSQGLGMVYKSAGCMPQLVLGLLTIAAAIWLLAG